MADGGAEVDVKKAVQDVKAHVAAAMRLATTTEGNAVDLQAKLVPEVRHRLVLLFALMGRWHVLVSVSVSVCGRARVLVLVFVPYMRLRAGGCGWPYSNLLHWPGGSSEGASVNTHGRLSSQCRHELHTKATAGALGEGAHCVSRHRVRGCAWPVFTIARAMLTHWLSHRWSSAANAWPLVFKPSTARWLRLIRPNSGATVT